MLWYSIHHVMENGFPKKSYLWLLHVTNWSILESGCYNSPPLNLDFFLWNLSLQNTLNTPSKSLVGFQTLSLQHKDPQNQAHNLYPNETSKGQTVNQSSIEINTLRKQPPSDTDVYSILNEKHVTRQRNEHLPTTTDRHRDELFFIHNLKIPISYLPSKKKKETPWFVNDVDQKSWIWSNLDLLTSCRPADKLKNGIPDQLLEWTTLYMDAQQNSKKKLNRQG